MKYLQKLAFQAFSDGPLFQAQLEFQRNTLLDAGRQEKIGIFTVFNQITENRGFGGLWTGFLAKFMLRFPIDFIMRYIRIGILKQFGFPGLKPEERVIIKNRNWKFQIAQLISSIFELIIQSPFILLAIELTINPRNSMWQTTKSIYKKNGIKGFYKGFRIALIGKIVLFGFKALYDKWLNSMVSDNCATTDPSKIGPFKLLGSGLEALLFYPFDSYRRASIMNLDSVSVLKSFPTFLEFKKLYSGLWPYTLRSNFHYILDAFIWVARNLGMLIYTRNER